jgi:hypothetical protein
VFRFPDRFLFGDNIEREIPRERILRDEMLTPEDFTETNEARTCGIIFYNPNNRLSIRGAFPLPIVEDSHVPPENLSPGIARLADAIRIYSDLVLADQRMIQLIGNSHFDFPFLYIACKDQWEYFPAEAKETGEYLRNGGFVFFENLTPWLEYSPAEASLRQFIRDALGPGTSLVPIPNDHPIYRSYFDFPEGPPLGSENNDPLGRAIYRLVPYLEGVWIRGRLAALYSNKGYGNLWDVRPTGDTAFKIGMNILIFALRQEGGKAVKQFDPSLEPGIMAHRLRSVEPPSPSGGQRNMSAPGVRTRSGYSR